jgi:hypothetical protein
MSNYQQPNSTFGSYDEGSAALFACPRNDGGTARLVGSGSQEYTCSTGHFGDASFLIGPALPFAPVRKGFAAESRIRF